MIVVHDRAQAEAALQAAAELAMPVVLMSPPGFALYAGAAYFAAMIGAARRAVPDVEATAVLDCGAAPGHALAALRLGIDAVRLKARPRVRAAIAEIAEGQGAALWSGRARALDLADVADARRACRDWLVPKRRRGL